MTGSGSNRAPEASRSPNVQGPSGHLASSLRKRTNIPGAAANTNVAGLAVPCQPLPRLSPRRVRWRGEEEDGAHSSARATCPPANHDTSGDDVRRLDPTRRNQPGPVGERRRAGLDPLPTSVAAQLGSDQYCLKASAQLVLQTAARSSVFPLVILARAVTLREHFEASRIRPFSDRSPGKNEYAETLAIGAPERRLRHKPQRNRFQGSARTQGGPPVEISPCGTSSVAAKPAAGAEPPPSLRERRDAIIPNCCVN